VILLLVFQEDCGVSFLFVCSGFSFVGGPSFSPFLCLFFFFEDFLCLSLSGCRGIYYERWFDQPPLKHLSFFFLSCLVLEEVLFALFAIVLSQFLSEKVIELFLPCQVPDLLRCLPLQP